LTSVIFSLTSSIKAVQSVFLLCILEAFLLPFPGSTVPLYSMVTG
jgi:hypothetical protein